MCTLHGYNIIIKSQTNTNCMKSSEKQKRYKVINNYYFKIGKVLLRRKVMIFQITVCLGTITYYRDSIILT